MPLGLSNALTIAKSGLYLNQYLISVHGQNIANANNPDYAKKTVDIQPTTPITNVSPGAIGTGVTVNEVSRVIDQFLEVQLTKNKGEIGKWEIINKYSKQLERIFNNATEGSLSKSFDEFWNAWLDLSNNPSDDATRMTLLQKSEMLIDYIHDSYNELANIESSIDEELKEKVTEANEIAIQIANLNKNIFNTEINENTNANDLRDERDKLVKKLSKIIDITYVEENNKFDVFLNNGTSLVTGVFYNELIAEGDIDNRNKSSVYWTDGKSSKLNISDIVKSGEIKGLLYLRDEIVGEYKNRLSTLANAIMKEVNSIHSQGVGLEAFTSVTGTVAVDNADLPFNFANLQSSVQSGSFKIIVYDNSTGVGNSSTITIGDPEDIDNPNVQINTLNELVSYINGSVNHITASIVNNKLKLTSDSGYTFAFAEDTSGVLSGLGINTFFKGKNYQFTKDVDIVGTEDSGNTDHISSVKYTNRNLLTGHKYTISFAGGNITINDNNTGENISSFETSTVDGHYTLDFEGIRIQFGAAKPADGNTYYIENADAVSMIDDDNFTDHVFRVDFNTGVGNVSVFDVTENVTLSSNDFTAKTLDVDNDGTDDYVTVKIPDFGITVTVKADSYGVVQITPDKVGAKYIENNITDTNYINAAKVQTDNNNIFSEGDNRNALDIADLRDSEVMDEDSVTFTEYLSSFLAKVGYDSSFVDNKLEAANITSEGLQKQRDNVSGVSLDEEMTKLIQIQHSYSANAKLLTVVDTLLQNLMAAIR